LRSSETEGDGASWKIGVSWGAAATAPDTQQVPVNAANAAVTTRVRIDPSDPAINYA